MKTVITLRVSDTDYCKRIKDPFDSNLHHLETLLPFSEVNKLVRGNANVRAPKESSKPFKSMIESVEKNPRAFHVKNRGITFICEAFELTQTTNGVRQLNITLADDGEGDYVDEEISDARKVGIGDGGHTFAVVSNTMQRIDALKAIEDWTEPFVRVRFITSKAAFVVPEEMVEALNTSTQVKEHTMDEYRNEFQPLKDIFSRAGFDIRNISFRENDTGAWDIRDILQRLGCFLKDKQALGPQMYKSKQKALKLYIDPKSREEFLALSEVMVDVAFLPEYIEAQFSSKENLKNRNRFGGLRVVKPLKEDYVYPGIGLKTRHRLDLAATLPLAGAFRELLQTDPKTGKQVWVVDWKEAFKRTADELYRSLTNNLASVSPVASLGSDPAYWTTAANVILRVKSEMLQERLLQPTN
ncbi:MAG TPA: AIPR family protein [Candidatus Acidoferrales bacterium]|nr:AIPR family protein [Candidatus Acidoferrales bacterium]